MRAGNRVAARGEEQPMPVGRDHREAVERLAIGQLLLLRAVQVAEEYLVHAPDDLHEDVVMTVGRGIRRPVRSVVVGDLLQIASIVVDGEQRHRQRMLAGLLVLHLPGAEDDLVAVRKVERSARLPAIQVRYLHGVAAIGIGAPEVEFAVGLWMSKENVLSIGPYRDLGVVGQVVGDPAHIATVEVGGIDLRALRIVIRVRVVSLGQLRMIAR